MRFSIIMPVYNAGKYLRAAIDSVLSQSFRDFELILIDDGATDGSGMTCDEYAKKDSRVRVIHQSNKGICASRNIGIELANGEYIGFCDHDDEYLPGYLEAADKKLAEHAKDSVVEIIKFNRVNCKRYKEGRTELSYPGLSSESQRWTHDSSYELFTAINAVIWNGFYRSEFLRSNNLLFDESFKYGGEDIAFMQHALVRATGVWWEKETFYIHYINMGVSTSSFSHLELFDDYLRIIHFELKEFSDIKPEFLRLRRWLDTLGAFVLEPEGCHIGTARKTQMFATYIRTLLPTDLARNLSLQGSEDRSWRFFAYCARNNLYLLAGAAEALWRTYPKVILTAARLLIRKKQ